MKTIITVFALLTLFASCKKDDSASPATTTQTNTGTIRFNNTSSNPYQVNIDGVSHGILQGKSFSDVTVDAGTHTTEVIQQSGYLVYPTDESNTVNVASGGTISIVFP